MRAAAAEPAPDPQLERLDLRVCIPLLSVHLGCALVLLTGVSAVAVAACAVLFWLRAFGLTAGYHRLLSHRSYETSRPFRFGLAALGASAAQLGPLWWPAHHRQHHRHADTDLDPHPPGVRGLWWAHMGWLLRQKYSAAPLERVPDLARLPELRFLDRWHALAPLGLAALLFALGSWLEAHAPHLGTSGLQLVVWGFFVSTTLLYHATFAVNSLGHARGPHDAAGRDASRNLFLLSLLTLGDGWHENHHCDPGAARHGLRWWQPDATYAALRALAWLGLVWDLREPNARAATTAAAHSPAKRSPARA